MVSVDYQIEVHLKRLEDELKAAEQEYLQKIQCLVAKYTAKATEIRQNVCSFENNQACNHYCVHIHSRTKNMKHNSMHIALIKMQRRKHQNKRKHRPKHQ